MNQEEQPAAEIAQQAVKISVSLYGVVPRTQLLRSGRSHVFRLDFRDGRESKLLKIARISCEGDVLREQLILPALHLRGFEVPRIEYTQEHADFGVPFTIMDFVEGVGLEGIGGMAPAVARAAYEHIGHFMARLSVLDAQTIPGAQSPTVIYEFLECNRTEYREVLKLHPRCTARMTELFERGYDLQHETTGFAHWDGMQVITDGLHTFTVIDWGIAGVGNRLFDLSMFLMWHGFSVAHMHSRPLYSEWRAAVLHGYSEGRPMTAAMRTRLHLLGMSFGLRQAMAMAQNNHPRTDDFLTYLESEDIAIQSGS
ncbi:MAG: Phosphotransferase enzyme family [Chthonomonadaceae bacterium]|nr:Phosphotransferase enzyme family [Chthonomonadaceae bacterium]